MSVQDVFVPQKESDENNATQPKAVNMSVPDHWQFVKLREVLREVDIRAEELKVVESEEVPVLSLTKNRGLIPQNERFNNRVATQDISNYKVLNKGQIVYNPFVLWEGAIYALKDREQGLVSPAYLVWEATKANNVFLDYLLRTPQLLNEYLRVASGVVQRRRAVRKDVFLNIRVPLPPLSEQQAIAQVLETVKEAILTRNVELKLEIEHKAALMDYLLRHGTHGEPYKRTEIGEMPESWEIVTFGEAVKIANGQVNPTEEPYKSMQHVGPENIEQDTGKLLETKSNQELGIGSGNYYFTSEDILYSKIRPYLNKVALPSFDGTCSADMYPLRPVKAYFTREFLYHLMLSERIKNQAIAYQNRTGIPKINRDQLGSILLSKPSIEEQSEIALVLSTCNAKIYSLEDEVLILEELFRAFLEELMTGRLSTQLLIEEGETHD